MNRVCCVVLRYFNRIRWLDWLETGNQPTAAANQTQLKPPTPTLNSRESVAVLARYRGHPVDFLVLVRGRVRRAEHDHLCGGGDGSWAGRAAHRRRGEGGCTGRTDVRTGAGGNVKGLLPVD